MSKHTMGPLNWRGDGGAGIRIFGMVADMDTVCLPDGISPGTPVQIYHLTEPVAVMIAYERWVQFEPKGWHEMQEANANLFCAATELLAMCKALLDHATLFNHESDNVWTGLRDEARTIIAKAEGREQ